MPIYEYQAVRPEKGCGRCRGVFEVLQGILEEPLSECPTCHQEVRRLISRCYAAIVEESEEARSTERRISEYERAGMWSHAAELADKYSEETGDRGLKERALHDYRKAGYDVDKWSGGE